jgi:hypothetical protein
MRRLVALLIVASLALCAAVAQAAVPKGTYAGKFSDGGKVTLSVSKERKLIKLVRRGLKFTCTDGDKFASLKSTATGDVDVADGDFDISDTTENDAVTWKMTGKFSTKKRVVKGTYTETRTFNSNDQLDPNGTVTCQTASLTYRAALPKKR